MMKKTKNQKKQAIKTRKTTVQRMREVMVCFDAGMSWRMMLPHFEKEWGMKETPVKRVLKKVREAIEAEIPRTVEAKRNELWSDLKRVYDAAFTERNLETCVNAARVMKDLCLSGTDGAPGTLQVVAKIENLKESFDLLNSSRPTEVKK